MACRSSFAENSGTANVDRRNELFIGGSSLKLRQGASQSSMITVDMEDSFPKRTVTGDARIAGEKAGGMMNMTATTTMDTHRKESGGGGFRRGSAHNYIPWSRRDSFGGGSRPPSLLERSLIPGLKKNLRVPFPSYGAAAETAQMTIFYAGNVNVYENVPADKAFGVMVLANKCSVAQPDPVQEQEQEQDHATTQGLPLARQQSLRRFLEKRRGRLVNNLPYAKLDDK